MQKELGKWNAKLLMSAALPQYEFMGRGPAPRKIEDFKGMRVRALGGIGKAMAAIGAVPTTVTAPETYRAIERRHRPMRLLSRSIRTSPTR